jgi:hypothetical protein
MREPRGTRTAHFRSLVTFLVLVACTCGPIAVSLLVTNRRDPLLGAHQAVRYGLDPVSLVIPGGTSYWSSLTRGYWTRLLPIAVSETSVYLGGVLIVGLVISLALRRRLRLATSWAWWAMLLLFAALALGPRFRFDGTLHPAVPLPYAVLERVVPGFKLSGMPGRMTVVVVFAAIIIVIDLVSALQARIQHKHLQWLFVLALGLVSLVELRPREVPPSSASYPKYVAALARLPHNVGVIDEAAPSAAAALYYQTVDGLPMAYGYVSRLPTSAAHRDGEIAAALSAGRYGELCARFHLRYLATHATNTQLRAVYAQPGRDPVHIYDMQRQTSCAK